MRRYKKDERSSEWHHRNEDSSKDDWWSAVDIRTRGSVEGLVWHQNCCGFSCKTDGELFLVRCQLGGDNNGSPLSSSSYGSSPSHRSPASWLPSPSPWCWSTSSLSSPPSSAALQCCCPCCGSPVPAVPRLLPAFPSLESPLAPASRSPRSGPAIPCPWRAPRFCPPGSQFVVRG